MTTQDDTTLDGYDWPVCLACSHNLWDDELDRLVCRPCEDGTRTRLKRLPGLFAKLNKTTALMPGSRKSNGAAPSGSRTPPLPVRLDVLDLIAPKGGVAEKLQNIEDAWRKSLGRKIGTWAGSPGEAVPTHVQFLVINLQKACQQYESIGQDIDEIRKLHAKCEALVNGEQRSGKVPIGVCPVRVDTGLCATPLTATAASHRVHCGSCGTRWDGMGEWRNLRAAQEALALETAGAAA